MCSFYLSEEACRSREQALVRRIAGEFIKEIQTWSPDSDYWRLPASLKKKVEGWVATVSVFVL
jgi:hypothetical protein